MRSPVRHRTSVLALSGIQRQGTASSDTNKQFRVGGGLELLHAPLWAIAAGLHNRSSEQVFYHSRPCYHTLHDAPLWGVCDQSVTKNHQQRKRRYRQRRLARRS